LHPVVERRFQRLDGVVAGGGVPLDGRPVPGGARNTIWAPLWVSMPTAKYAMNGSMTTRPTLLASISGSASPKSHGSSERLGHNNPELTLKVYAHLMPGDGRETARVLDQMFGGYLAATAEGQTQESPPASAVNR
jgi:hypothetical protein